MKKLSAKELRELWIEFFKNKDHMYIESKSLIPENDPSLLWINSGVATLKNYFSGIENPPSNRLVNLQKAVRTNDIENVGKTSRHHTFFEMMGNFSIGDYSKKEAIEFAYDLLVNKLEIDKNLLYITVYKEDNDAYDEWIKLGISPDHIFKEGKDRNFWDVGSGPCGPCTEIYYDRGEKYDFSHKGIELLKNDVENDRYVEIWNIVFSEYNNNGKNEYTELKRKNIDTGAGYERFLSVLQGVPTNFDTDLFLPLINELEKYTEIKYDINAFFTHDKVQEENNRCFKVIVDHIKSAVFMVADGALPSNKDRGYILRRLIRRAIVCASKLNLKNGWLDNLVLSIIKKMYDFYPYLENYKEKIRSIIATEYLQFEKTLEKGLKIFEEATKQSRLTAEAVFDLVQTYGFPKLLVDEMCEQRNISYDEKEYENLFKKHQDISKSEEINKIKALVQQNKNLLELNVNSEFDYEKNFIPNVKVVKLFDNEFNPVETLYGEGWVVLDKTCLYATGGGQLHDEGWINDFEVDNVIKAPNLQHLHHVVSAYLKINELVNVKLNLIFRTLLRCNHTGVHLVQAMLKKYVSESIKQAGAFKSKDKWSFDFTYEKKLSNEQVNLIQEKVNQVIQESIPIEIIHTSLEDAKKRHAIMEFNDMYSKQKVLRLIKIGDVSLELCGGTHAKNTSELEILKITDFRSLGSGVWRLEGFTRYLTYYSNIKNNLNFIINNHKEELNKFTNIPDEEKLNNLNVIDSLYLVNKFLNEYEQQKINDQKNNEIKEIKTKIENEINSSNVVIFNNVNPKYIAAVLKEKANEIPNILIVINILEEGYGYFITFNKQYIENNNVNTNLLIQELNKNIDGRGGGKNTYFQGGTNKNFDLKIFKDLASNIK